jgi:hypothetical protein
MLTTQSLPTHDVAFLQAAFQIGFQGVTPEQIARLSPKGQAVARELQGVSSTSKDADAADWAQVIRVTALPRRPANT